MKNQPIVSVIMGSKSDWETMKEGVEILKGCQISYESEVVSAHRTNDKLTQLAKAEAGRGIKVIIAGAGGAAHLPGMVAANTELPVLGVPIQSQILKGVDSLLSIVQMPFGIPVGTLAIGKAGAKNAGLLATAIIAKTRPELKAALIKFRTDQTNKVLAEKLD